MKIMIFFWLFLSIGLAAAQPAFLGTRDIADGFSSPVSVTHAGDGSNRLFVTQQGGQVKVVQGGVHLATPFLDISGLISCCGEQGLLGLAFHPDYATNGYFYVNYTDTSGDTVVARYNVSAGDANVADPNSASMVLTFNQPFGAHNGGDLNFSPADGFLYISSGDGSGDPMASQNPDSLLGKMLRIDVNGDDFPGDADKNYAIPPDNPFVGTAGADEVWVSGLRNPWRFSFDRLNGDLFIGDVGEDSWEEFNHVPATSSGGENFGWPCFEGADASGLMGCDSSGPNELPIAALQHDQPGSNYCTAVGGYRYRGAGFAGLYGWYLFTDWCDGTFFAAQPAVGGGWEFFAMSNLVGGFSVTSMGEDEQGELYAVAGNNLIQITGPGDEIFINGFESN